VGDAGPGPSFIEANGRDHFYTRIPKEHPIAPEGNTVPCTHAGQALGHAASRHVIFIT